MDEYTVTINGLDHTMLLDKDDAERLGAKAATKKSDAPATKKASAPANKTAS